MNTLCSQELLERSLAGLLGDDDEAALSRHLDECEVCAAELERLAGGESKCREIATLLTPDELDDAVAHREECSTADFVVEHLEPSDDPSVLGRIGPYDVLEIIGRGGMGIVLKGFDRELKRFVAIKALAPHLAHSALARKRFSREAQAAAAVVDLHVIAIHHVQSSGPLPFLVMPLLNGESLAARIKARGSLELTEVLRIGMQAALGLAAAHAQGLVHRDIKPANILLEKGVERAVLTDFGLARAGDDVSMTRWGIIAGTPEYMSPEQARGASLDARSDLFSLGCVLYEMATGVSPFRAESTMATLRRIVDDKPTALASLAPNLPPWFAAIVEQLLAKDPTERFATASEVSELLEQCLSHLQQPTTVPLPTAVRTRTSRHSGRPPLARWLVASAAGFILLLAGILLVLELNKGQLTIECSADRVPIRILQGDVVAKKMTVTKAGTTVRVAAGHYIVEIDGGQDDVEVQGGNVTLKRGGVETVRIAHKKNQLPAKQENAQPKVVDRTNAREVTSGFNEERARDKENLDAVARGTLNKNDDSANTPSADATSDQVEETAMGLPTPEAAASALIRAYAERDYELFLKVRLRTVCETNDKDGPSKYADALHFSQLMRGKDQLTVYDLKRRLKPDSIRALGAHSSRELTRAIETALQFYGEEYKYVDVTSDGFDGSQYVIRVIVARNGNQWYAIPHGYSSENAYEAVNAVTQATEEAPAK